MKRFAVLFLSLAATLALADAGDDIVTQALTNLQTNPWFKVTLIGVEDTDGAQKGFESDLWWQLIGAGSLGTDCRLECRDMWDGSLTTRSVGDGTNFWGYDVAANRYTVSRYGSYGTAQPATYVKGMIDAFTASSKGPTEYLARLLSNTYAAGTVQYTPWMLPALPGEVAGSTVSSNYVCYKFGNPVYRWIGFTVSQDSTGTYSLVAFDYHNVQKIGTKTRTTWWTATIDTTDTPPPMAFVFSAPPGSRPLAGPHPSSL